MSGKNEENNNTISSFEDIYNDQEGEQQSERGKSEKQKKSSACMCGSYTYHRGFSLGGQGIKTKNVKRESCAQKIILRGLKQREKLKTMIERRACNLELFH